MQIVLKLRFIHRFDDDEPDFFKPGFRTVVVENILLKTRFDVRLDEVSGEQTPTIEELTNGEKGKPDIFSIGIHKLIHDGVFVDKFSLHDVRFLYLFFDFCKVETFLLHYTGCS